MSRKKLSLLTLIITGVGLLLMSQGSALGVIDDLSHGKLTDLQKHTELSTAVSGSGASHRAFSLADEFPRTIVLCRCADRYPAHHRPFTSPLVDTDLRQLFV